MRPKARWCWGWGFSQSLIGSLAGLLLAQAAVSFASEQAVGSASSGCIPLPKPLWGSGKEETRSCVSVDELLTMMSLDEKIGQMTQANRLSLERQPEDVTTLALGSMLSGGGDAPTPNTAQSWAEMTRSYQERALATRLGIPLLYGIDAVHGHNNVRGAVLFPHNIGLGAAADPELMRKIGEITASEVRATGVHWDFAPAVSVPHDIRWGRTYEGFSEDTDLVTHLSRAYLEGLQAVRDGVQVIGTAKHFVGDGGTRWGSSDNELFRIDQGNTVSDEASLRRVHLAPYLAAIDAGVRSVMVSYSRWNDEKMHSHRYLITDVLKHELGFTGLVVSDWLGVFRLPGSLDEQVAAAVNAGIDMVMAVDRYRDFIEALKRGVSSGQVSMARIDDAVRRILSVKLAMGLFDQPFGDSRFLDQVGSPEHRQVAREAVQQSLVLLKNDSGLLPLRLQSGEVLVAGSGAHDLGIQSGGWSLDWQGHLGNERLIGTTLLQGITNQAPQGVTVRYLASGSEARGEAQRRQGLADVGILILGERPYAEGFGDDGELQPAASDRELFTELRVLCKQLVLISVAGRPLMLTELLDQAEAFVAAWLPGTEGDGLGDVLWGRAPFTGRLAITWPRSLEGYQGIPVPAEQVLFPFGAGLGAGPSL